MTVWQSAVCAVFACVLGVAPVFAASADRVRFLEGPQGLPLSPGEVAEEVKGYLPAGAVDAGAFLNGPPAVDSAGDKADVAHVLQVNRHANAARWGRALLDDASVYDRFTDQLGFRPDRKRFPRFVQLLNRVAEDALAAGGEAKKRFPRSRPFQRFQLMRVCGQAKAPKPDASASGGTAYPSGHAVVSWAVALVMMEASPSSAQAIVLRAVDYGESRVVCGVHFPTDIDAGHLVATAVVDKLFALPEFRRDFKCAKTELQSVRAGMRAEDLPAC
ncbi:MAG: phosphatase PAP2 family protein [Alphaproteobacteria bacterium]|jgi:acid phosphatase (class A)|nr:phosphatase PAP2 family protein [Alphaproteobacteria bacterium]